MLLRKMVSVVNEALEGYFLIVVTKTNLPQIYFSYSSKRKMLCSVVQLHWLV